MSIMAREIGVALTVLVLSAAACSESSPPASPAGGRSSSPEGHAGSSGLGGAALSTAAGEGGGTSVAEPVAEGGGGSGAAGDASAGSGAGAGGDEAPLGLAEIVASYEAWEPLSEEAFNVSAAILALCRSPSAREEAFVESEHSGFALRHWANPSAFAALDDETAHTFPEGATLVKQKLGYPAGGTAPVVLALGIMVKRHAGFNEPNGDWEFAYYTESDGILADVATQTACGSCHADPNAKDFVFADDSWRQ